jgi:hypothetical protein
VVSSLARLPARLRAAREARRRAARQPTRERDVTPALGTPGEPGKWERAVDGAEVALQRPQWEDARWSYLYKDDTRYKVDGPFDERAVASAALAARQGAPPEEVRGPVQKPPVWTWEVPLYFWTGGIASGAAFVSLACDLAGDHKSAMWARRVSLAGLAPSPPLLIMDLGRPERFYNMLRIFKPRSPMSTGAWCLTLFGNLAAASVGADLLGRRRTARILGGANAVVGGYLGSYTGVLLAATAVPVWNRSKYFLGPIFIATATATGAAATRLVLVAAGLPEGHPTRVALGRVERGAMVAELGLSLVNRRLLGRLAEGLERGTPGLLFKIAERLVYAGLALRMARPPLSPRAHDLASLCYLGAGAFFRYAWVYAGPPSARDDEGVARMARARATRYEPPAEMRAVRPGG